MGGGFAGVVDDDGALWDDEGGGGASAVALVASGEVFLDAVGVTAGLALAGGGVEVEFKGGLGKDVGADVAAFHDKVAKLCAGTLLLLHPLADTGDGGDGGDGGAGLGGADFCLGVIAIDEQARVAVLAGKLVVPLAAVGGDGLGVAGVDTLLQAMPGKGAVHGAGVDVGAAEGLGDEFRVGAFAAGAGAVDGDDEGIAHSAFRASPTRGRPAASRISAPTPCGGGAASFWKKLGKVLRTQAGSRSFMPGTLRPRMAKHIAMRWSR